MRPFNLDQALSGEPVICRNGQKVKIAGYNKDAAQNHRLVGWVEEWSREWFEDGRYLLDIDSEYDLFMEEFDLYILLIKPQNGKWQSAGISSVYDEVLNHTMLYDLSNYVHKIVKVTV